MIPTLVAAWADEDSYAHPGTAVVFIPGESFVVEAQGFLDEMAAPMVALSDGSAAFDKDWQLRAMEAVSEGYAAASPPVDGSAWIEPLSPAAVVLDVAAVRRAGGISGPRSFGWHRVLAYRLAEVGARTTHVFGPGVRAHPSETRQNRLADLYYRLLEDDAVVAGIEEGR